MLKEPPQQTFSNMNFLNMRKFAKVFRNLALISSSIPSILISLFKVER